VLVRIDYSEGLVSGQYIVINLHFIAIIKTCLEFWVSEHGIFFSAIESFTKNPETKCRVDCKNP